MAVGARVLIVLEEDGVVLGYQETGRWIAVEIVLERVAIGLEIVCDRGSVAARWNDQVSSARITIPDGKRSSKRLWTATRCRTSSIVALVPSGYPSAAP